MIQTNPRNKKRINPREKIISKKIRNRKRIKEGIEELEDYVDNSRIIELINERDSAIVFYKSSDIEEISRLSGMINKEEEYQVHYIALVMVQNHPDKSKELSIFPIAYYNYPQKVTYATIDAKMTDISDKAREIQELAMYAAKELKDKLIEQLAIHNEDLEFFITMFNNIHRHP